MPVLSNPNWQYDVFNLYVNSNFAIPHNKIISLSKIQPLLSGDCTYSNLSSSRFVVSEIRWKSDRIISSFWLSIKQTQRKFPISFLATSKVFLYHAINCNYEMCSQPDSKVESKSFVCLLRVTGRCHVYASS